MADAVNDLKTLLLSMAPRLNEGAYVFACVADDAPAGSNAIVTVREEEGVTIVVAQNEADELGLAYDYVCAWITLDVHSSLNAVGLTAALSRALTDEGISANVVAGFYHDHVFVPQSRAQDALACLRALGH